MERDAEHGARRRTLLLALLAALVLGTGVLLVARESVDQAAVTAAPGDGQAEAGRTGAGGAGEQTPVDPAGGTDTATSSPDPSAGVDEPGPPAAGQPPADAPAAATASGPAVPGAASPGAPGAPTAPEGGTLPYGTAPDDRAAAAAAPDELAQTGPPAPSLVGLVLTLAALGLARLARRAPERR